MAERLTVDLTLIRKTLGHFLGYGRDYEAATMTAKQKTDISDTIDTGLRRFYYNAQHEWSFLKPTMSLVLWPTTTFTVTTSGRRLTSSVGTFYESMIGKSFVYTSGGTYTIDKYVSGTVIEFDTEPTAADAAILAGAVTADGDYTLPIDFGAMGSEATFGEDQSGTRLVLGDQVAIRRGRQSTSSTGIPYRMAERVEDVGSENEQRHILMVYPTPDQAYTITFNYVAYPYSLTLSHPYPLGGDAHGDTILESCLAAAEESLDDDQTLHTGRFQERLAASIAFDKRKGPESLGYNGNFGWGRGHEDARNWGRIHGNRVVSYNSVTYP